MSKAPAIRVLKIDLDDTMLKDAENTVHQPTWQKLFPDGVNNVPGVGIGMQPLEVISKAAAFYNMEEGCLVLEARRQAIISDLVEDQSHDLELNPGAQSLLEEARQSNLKNVIITSGSLDYARAFIHRFGLRDYIDFVVTGSLTDGTKPSSIPFDYAYNRLKMDLPGLRPNEIAFVGDTPGSDIKGAKEAGLWVIGLETPHASKQQLEDAGAHLVVSSLEDINPGPGGTFDKYPFNNGFHPEGAVLNQYAWLHTKEGSL